MGVLCQRPYFLILYADIVYGRKQGAYWGQFWLKPLNTSLSLCYLKQMCPHAVITFRAPRKTFRALLTVSNSEVHPWETWVAYTPSDFNASEISDVHPPTVNINITPFFSSLSSTFDLPHHSGLTCWKVLSPLLTSPQQKHLHPTKPPPWNWLRMSFRNRAPALSYCKVTHCLSSWTGDILSVFFNFCLIMNLTSPLSSLRPMFLLRIVS